VRVKETEYEGKERELGREFRVCVRTQGIMGKNIAELFGKEGVELICFLLYCLGAIFLWLQINI